MAAEGCPPAAAAGSMKLTRQRNQTHSGPVPRGNRFAWRCPKSCKEQIFVCSTYFTLGHFVKNPFSMFGTLGYRYKHHHSQVTHDTKRTKMLRQHAQSHPTGKWHSHNSDCGPLAQEPYHSTMSCSYVPNTVFSTFHGGWRNGQEETEASICPLEP